MAKQDRLDYGERLSDEEYDRAIVALQHGLPSVPSREQRRAVRRRELDLAIDHRLGREFPGARRDALWAIQQRVERRRMGLMLWYLLRRLFAGRLIKKAQGLAGYLVEAYGKELNEAELERFFGKNEVRHPGLPVDPEQLKK
jgi:hypothetical protein